MTIPGKLNSKNQRYVKFIEIRLWWGVKSNKGKAWL